MLVPALLTKGRAAQMRSEPQSIKTNAPFEHKAKDVPTHAFSVQVSFADRVWNSALSFWASCPF